jgi:hypothetical protein
VSIQGTLDSLVPPSRYADTYDRLIAGAGRSALHRETRVTGGTHTDGLVPLSPATFRPMLPAFTMAFTQLERWTS